MMKRTIVFLLLAAGLLAACNEKESGPTLTEADLDVELAENTWTYVSLETGAVVGTCAFADSTGQRDFAARTDWDVAFAPGGLMRTNSGTSGQGKGGVVLSEQGYDATDLTAPVGFVVDAVEHEVW